MRSSISFLCLLTGLAAGGAAWADDDVAELAMLRREAVPGAGGNDAPRLIRNDSPAEAQRSLPGYRSASTELGYRWWMSRGRADLGLGLGTITYGARATGSVPGLGSEGAVTAFGSGTVLTLGMRYRTSDRSAIYADAAGVRGPGLDSGDAVVGKVGIEFQAAQSQFNIAYGGLGVRLAGDARMTVRVRRGGLGVFMVRSF